MCRCLKGRRLIFIGDSLTWQMYNSLACLLAPVTVNGTALDWDESPTAVRGSYKGREWPEVSLFQSIYYVFSDFGRNTATHIWSGADICTEYQEHTSLFLSILTDTDVDT